MQRILPLRRLETPTIATHAVLFDGEPAAHVCVEEEMMQPHDQSPDHLLSQEVPPALSSVSCMMNWHLAEEEIEPR